MLLKRKLRCKSDGHVWIMSEFITFIFMGLWSSSGCRFLVLFSDYKWTKDFHCCLVIIMVSLSFSFIIYIHFEYFFFFNSLRFFSAYNYLIYYKVSSVTHEPTFCLALFTFSITTVSKLNVMRPA